MTKEPHIQRAAAALEEEMEGKKISYIKNKAKNINCVTPYVRERGKKIFCFYK